MMAFYCVISNFEKKNRSIVNKIFFLQKFSQLKAFSRKSELSKKCNIKAIRSN